MAPDHASTRLAPAVAAAPPATAASEAAAVPRGRWAVPGWLPAVTATLAGLGAGGYRLGVPSPWRDEAATVDAAHRPVPQIVALLAHQDAVNGAYYLLMHPVILLLGSSPAAIRAPSVLAMAAAAGFTAALGRRLAARAGLPSPRSPACWPGCWWRPPHR